MSDAPSTPKLPKDIFQRESLAESMCELICKATSEAVSPIALNGPWGSGKTTHALRLQKCIREKYGDSHQCLYWNAARADYAHDPLPMLVALLYAAASHTEGKESFQALSLKLCCSAAWAATKTMTNMFIEKKTGLKPEEIIAAISEAGDEASMDFIHFKRFLEEASSDAERIEAAKSLINLARGKTELVIIIDELDRCRPDFALKLIETIKHLFESEHCKFILIMNKVAMSHSISHIYGLPIEEAEVYLNKLIKLNLHLPNILYSPGNSDSCSKVYFEHLTQKKIDDSTSGLFIKMLIDGSNMQLREVEKWLGNLNILARACPAQQLQQDDVMIIIAFVTYLVSFKQHLITSLINRDTTAEIVLQALHYPYNQIETDNNIAYCKNKLFYLLAIYLAKDAKQLDSLRCQYITDHSSFIWLEFGPQELSKWLRYSLFLR